MKKTLVLLLTLVFVLAAAGAAFAGTQGGSLSFYPGTAEFMSQVTHAIANGTPLPPFPWAGDPRFASLPTLAPQEPSQPPKGMEAVFTIGDVRYYSAPAGTEVWEYRPELNQYYQVAQERMSYEKKADVAPFILNDRTEVPMRYLAYALGATDSDVVWNQADQTVKLRIKTADETKTVELVLKIGSNILLKDGNSVTMDVAPVIKDNRTFLPARYVAEAAGYEVGWDEFYQGVLVGPPGNLPVHPKRTTPVDGGAKEFEWMGDA